MIGPAQIQPQEASTAIELARAILACRESKGPHVELLGDRIQAVGSLAVLPASFNPPTVAHMEMVRWALGTGGFGAALLLLDLRHAEKPLQDAHLVDRALMVKLAFREQPGVTLGIACQGLFLEKALALRKLLPVGLRWSFLVGQDTLSRILDPGFYQDPKAELEVLFSRCSFVVFRRAGWDWVKVPGPFRKSVQILELPYAVQGVSSSMVRESRCLGLTWTHLVCPEVADFIERTNLYLADPGLYRTRREALEGLLLCPQWRGE